MMYFFREIYYWCVGLLLKIRSNHLTIKFRAKIAPGSRVEGFNKLSHHSFFSGELGYASYIGENSVVVGKIGRFCSIAGNVRFLISTHPVSKFVSSHPAFYSTKAQCGFTFVRNQKFTETPLYDGKYSIVVGNDVYIGNGATIIGPVTIGDGAVVAANATVTSDVQPFTIVGGVPAKVIRKRFTDDQIEILKKMEWWNRDIQWIKENAEKFSDISTFIKDETEARG